MVCKLTLRVSEKMLLCSQQTPRVAYFQRGQERGQEALREGTWEREEDLAAESVKEVPYPQVPTSSLNKEETRRREHVFEF